MVEVRCVIRGHLLATLTVSYGLVVAGELVPRVVAAQRRMRTAWLCGKFM